MAREIPHDVESTTEIGNTLIKASMGSLYEVKLRNLCSHLTSQIRHFHSRTSLHAGDFISTRKISADETQELFQVFETSFEPFSLGGIAIVHSDLDSVRGSSPL